MSAASLRRWTAMFVLALAGLADALYLTWYHFDPSARVCLAGAGCEAVNASRYAVIGGVPVAVIGAAGYAVMLAVLAARRWGPPAARGAAGVAAYGFAMIGAAFALYLTALEAFVLHAYCAWCLVSAAIITAVCALAATDLAARRP